MQLTDSVKMHRASSHKNVGENILSDITIASILTSEDKAYVGLFIPEAVHDKPYHDQIRFPVYETPDVIQALVNRLLPNSLDETIHISRKDDSTSMVACTTSDQNTLEQAFNSAQIRFTPMRNLKMFVHCTKFNLVKMVEYMLLHPTDIELEQSSFTKTHARVRSLSSAMGEHYTVTLLVWVDGWASGKHSSACATTIKFRLLDTTGEVLPQKITAPYRLMEYHGQEKEFPQYYPFLEGALTAVRAKVFATFRGSSCTVRVDRIILMADNKAATMIIGTLGAGKYPCAFSPVCADNFGLFPFHARGVRLRPEDVRSDRAAFFDALSRTTTESLVKELYGDHPPENGTSSSRRPYNPLMGSLPLGNTLVQSTFYMPPIMHCSHELMECVATAVKQFDKPKDQFLRLAYMNITTGMEIERTIACSEQGRARKRLAAFAGPNAIKCVPKQTRPFFILAAMLQAQYYSRCKVTPESIVLHKIASMLVTLFLTAVGLEEEDGSVTLLPPGQATRMGRVTTKTTKMHEVAVAIPEIYARLRTPLFYLSEEALERDFLDNKEAQAQSHRAKILGSVILREQAQAVITRLTDQRRLGHRDINIDRPPTYRYIRIHNCTKKHKNWAQLAKLKTESPGEISPRLKEVVPHYWGSMSPFFELHSLPQPSQSGQWDVYTVGTESRDREDANDEENDDESELNNALEICICQARQSCHVRK